ncbi:hypothetical protein LINPERPRIM_LOCUS7210, partial [Linum perenne]
SLSHRETQTLIVYQITFCVSKGKPAHPLVLLVDRCGFTKHLSTVHSR